MKEEFDGLLPYDTVTFVVKFPEDRKAITTGRRVFRGKLRERNEFDRAKSRVVIREFM